MLNGLFINKGEIGILRFILALIIAVIGDVLDIVAFYIFSVPMIGDVADVITAGLLVFILRRPLAVVSFAEVVPASDPLPIHTLVVLATMGFDKLGGK